MNTDKLRAGLDACRTMRAKPNWRGDSYEPWLSLVEALAELTLQVAQEDGSCLGRDDPTRIVSAAEQIRNFQRAAGGPDTPLVVGESIGAETAAALAGVIAVHDMGIVLSSYVHHVHAELRECSERECGYFVLVPVRKWAQLRRLALAYDEKFKTAGLVLPTSVPLP